MHGGKIGWDSVPWDPLLDPSSSRLFTSAELATIQRSVSSFAIFSRISQDGEEGFPGTLLVEVLIGLLQPSTAPLKSGEWHLGSLLLDYRAKLLDDNTVTPINMTQVCCEFSFLSDGKTFDGLARFPSTGDSTSMSR